MPLTSTDDLDGKLHVATAASVVNDTDQGSTTLIFEEAFVTGQGRFINPTDIFRTFGLKIREFFLQAGFAFGKLCQKSIYHGLISFRRISGFAHLDFGGVDLFHHPEFNVFNPADFLFAGLDLFGESFVFLVFLGLRLLGGVLADEFLLGFDVQFQAFALGFTMLEGIFSRFQSLGGVIGFGHRRLALRSNAGKFFLSLKNLLIVRLKD